MTNVMLLYVVIYIHEGVSKNKLQQIKDTKDHRRCKHETGSYESGRFGALKSDSTHHFIRNACTKSGSLRIS
jgi:hypothetical protein